jgi:hypothetical protein
MVMVHPCDGDGDEEGGERDGDVSFYHASWNPLHIVPYMAWHALVPVKVRSVCDK